MVLGTGEDVPRGQSLKARLLVLEMAQSGDGAMDWDRLSVCQADAGAGLYAQAMAGFVRWLAPQYQHIQSGLKVEIDILRTQAYQGSQHRRTPNVVANLAIGLKKFIAFALEVGAISQIESEALWDRCWAALGDAAAAQQGHQASSDPVNRFLELLGASVSGGRAHLTDVHGKSPKMAVSWGWREVTFGTGDHQRKDWEPQGEHIGWVDGTNVYLQSDSAYAVVQKLARDGGDQIAVGLPTMKKRLHERGLLASTETSMSDGRVVERLDVRRSLQGKRRTVLHFNSPSWTSTTPDSVPSAPCVPIKEDTRLGEGTDGTQNGTQTEATRVVVYQDRAPAEDEVVPEPTDSGTHGALGTQILEGTPATSALKRKPHWEEPL